MDWEGSGYQDSPGGQAEAGQVVPADDIAAEDRIGLGLHGLQDLAVGPSGASSVYSRLGACTRGLMPAMNTGFLVVHVRQVGGDEPGKRGTKLVRYSDYGGTGCGRSGFSGGRTYRLIAS